MHASPREHVSLASQYLCMWLSLGPAVSGEAAEASGDSVAIAKAEADMHTAKEHAAKEKAEAATFEKEPAEKQAEVDTAKVDLVQQQAKADAAKEVHDKERTEAAVAAARAGVAAAEDPEGASKVHIMLNRDEHDMQPVGPQQAYENMDDVYEAMGVSPPAPATTNERVIGSPEVIHEA
jgi:hypothetical protein